MVPLHTPYVLLVSTHTQAESAPKSAEVELEPISSTYLADSSTFLATLSYLQPYYSV